MLFFDAEYFYKRLKIRPQLLWKANMKPHPIFRMVFE